MRWSGRNDVGFRGGSNMAADSWTLFCSRSGIWVCSVTPVTEKMAEVTLRQFLGLKRPATSISCFSERNSRNTTTILGAVQARWRGHTHIAALVDSPSEAPS